MIGKDPQTNNERKIITSLHFPCGDFASERNQVSDARETCVEKVEKHKSRETNEKQVRWRCLTR